MKKKENVIVCQHGARRRYVMARMIEELGLLKCLYIDSYSRSYLGRLALLLSPVINNQTLSRLAGRKVYGVPKNKVKSTDLPHLIEICQAIFKRKKLGLDLFLQRHALMSRRMKSWGVSKNDIVYSMYRENLDFIRWVKHKKAFLIVDVFISPLTEIVMEKEYAIKPEWAPTNISSQKEKEKLASMWAEVVQHADILVCPSNWVAEGIRKVTPEACRKVKVVPYGCSIDFNDKINKPTYGRILFVGGDALRKGLHYLAIASVTLAEKYDFLEFRVVGINDKSVINDPICKNFKFLGKLNKKEIQEEYLKADMFVLPSLSEGFAGVVAESIAAGCPVICTHETGAPIVNGREGLIIPSKSSVSITNAIDKFLIDRDFRNQCSINCINNREFYGEEHWKKRLKSVFDGI
ncbi:glycosyltransferase family 4 protein [Vibrio breoganii]|uniref:glycosyltransferase family 4 protein n=1 Tax=Vibrio breoganii TaxID=553239 RepID=UPI000C823571|nr:glycosyltransferase family 4 protein [Vibrio breoganii]PMK26266.1 hypothetical protein BCU06_18520 [Vibrio breoganii]